MKPPPRTHSEGPAGASVASRVRTFTYEGPAFAGPKRGVLEWAGPGGRWFERKFVLDRDELRHGAEWAVVDAAQPRRRHGHQAPLAWQG